MRAFPTVGLPDDDTVPLVTAQVLADKSLRAAGCLLSKQPPQQTMNTNNEDVLT
jgi:hypothetical protein